MLRLTAIWLLAATSVATAGPVADQAAKAEQQLEKGDAKAALADLEAAQDALWQKMPLTLTDIQHAVSITSVGTYEIRPSHSYKQGESVLIYLQAYGYGFGKDGFGNNKIEFTFDATMKSVATGAVVLNGKDVAFDIVTSRIKNRELFLKILFELGRLPADKYVADVTIRDKTSGKTANFSTDIEVTQ